MGALVNYLLVGGGGGGGANQGGGGGGGGVLSGTVYISSNETITVGAGGVGNIYGRVATSANDGGYSSIGSLIIVPGGGAGGGNWSAGHNGGSGGGSFSGGGTGYGYAMASGIAGYNGGAGVNAGFAKQGGGGGGGAGGAGASAVLISGGTTNQAGNGGSAISSSITGALQWYAEGGGGGSDAGIPGSGINGGGSGKTGGGTGYDATNYGCGGGGGSNGGEGHGGKGYQGIVILSYATDNYINGSGGTITDDGNGNTVHTFTSNETFTVPISAVGIPSGLSVSDINGKSITLEWLDAPYPAIQTNIYKNTTDSSATSALAGAISSGSQIFIAGGLQPITQYYFWLKAMDSDGNLSAFSSGVSATTTTAPEEGPSAIILGRTVVGGG